MAQIIRIGLESRQLYVEVYAREEYDTEIPVYPSYDNGTEDYQPVPVVPERPYCSYCDGPCRE
jgi:hypothetical protein